MHLPLDSMIDIQTIDITYRNGYPLCDFIYTNHYDTRTACTSFQDDQFSNCQYVFNENKYRHARWKRSQRCKHCYLKMGCKQCFVEGLQFCSTVMLKILYTLPHLVLKQYTETVKWSILLSYFGFAKSSTLIIKILEKRFQCCAEFRLFPRSCLILYFEDKF